MKVEQEIWTVKDFVTEEASIQIAPAWQRGPAWTAPRQVLLIDSMLRGLDIPKIYLRVRGQPNAYTYDAVDGQQRLRSIWLFRSGNLSLAHSEKLESVGGVDINDKKFSDLPKKLRDAFDAFEINVAKIIQADQIEISILFSRLQQGVPLNPAELRNAMLGPVRNSVETIALSHQFFLNSKIPESRYRRQDYVAHIFALAAHGTERDIKALNLKQLYQEFDSTHTVRIQKISAEIDATLDFLNSLNAQLGFTIRHKWIVVDLAWWVILQRRQSIKLNAQVVAERFNSFDQLRKKHTSAPEDVMNKSGLNRKLSKALYQYLVAFKLQGGTKGHILLRANALHQFLQS